MYGEDILCGLSKSTIWIPHKNYHNNLIHISKAKIYTHWQFQMPKSFKAWMRIWNARGMMTPSNGNIFRVLICAWTNSWSNNGDAGDLRRYRTHYDVTLMGSLHVTLRVTVSWQATGQTDTHRSITISESCSRQMGLIFSVSLWR